MNKDERLRAEITWSMSEEKIWTKTAFAETNFDWGTLGEAFETDQHYLLSYSTNRNMFQIIPKRAFSSEIQQAAFRRLVEQKKGKIQHIRSINLPEPSRKTVMLFIYGLLAILIIVTAASSYLQASGR